MKVNLTLFTTKLSPTDTIYFASKQAQESYFNSLPKVGYYTKLSYNGQRNIRLTGAVPYLLTTSPANYARIEYLESDEISVKSIHYCFIDNIVYINDSCYEIELTIDYIQTFLYSPITVYGDYALIAENRNFSTPLRRSYGNVLPVAIMREQTLYNPRQSYQGRFEFVYAVLTIKSKDTDEYNPNLNTGLASYVLPAIVMSTTQQDPIVEAPRMLGILGSTYYKNANNVWTEVNARDFLLSEAVQGNFVGLTIVDDIGLKKGFTISREEPSSTWNDENSIYIKIDRNDGYQSKVYLPTAMGDAYRNSASGLTYAKTTAGLTDKPAGLLFFTASPMRELSLRYQRQKQFHVLQREPYSWLELRQRGQQAQRISFTDNKAYWGESEESDEPDLFRLKYVFNPLYPNTTTYYLHDSGSINEIFTVEPAVSNLAFSVDQWAQYYMNNKASVNDGLATKHSYDMEIANRTLGTQIASAGLNMATGLASAVTAKDVAKGIGAVTGATSQLVGSVTAYENTKTNIEKESALLELSYQDLKSAPATVNNQTLNQNSFASISGGFKIVLVSPNYDEYNTISRYHTIYGFKLEEYTNTQIKYNSSNVSLSEFLKPSTDSALNNYRYLCAKDVKLQNGLKNICQIISGILENGLKIWGSASNLETSNYPYEQYNRNTLPLTQISLFRS